MYIAFYKPRKKLHDKIISFTSRGPYTHVELIVDGKCYSSSARDNGCRWKYQEHMHFDDPGKWDIFEIKQDRPDVKIEEEIKNSYLNSLNMDYKVHKSNKGKYDYPSIVLFHILRLFFLPKLFRDKYICSDIVPLLIDVLLRRPIDDKGYKRSPSQVFIKYASEGLLSKVSNDLFESEED